ncbi:HAMP domain-containing sensor histidine kinase [Inconstantimicrobium porci]|uniref:HAMP domain-containing sensor histidine kinase n=1 Tax=Inconstantimicrobium porci TaxID=2652291 RepID=UPI00240A7A9D|nr:HAMP domain-containing sensor histidine kinase [Inconstantimicrobium porci]MDD6770855.1 HAMP domain-containing sensor histidine kinase [Inconstantimicrobium porci]
MDWIEKLFEDIVEKIKSLITKSSLKRTMSIYCAIAIVIVLTAYAVTNSLCFAWKRNIYSRYNINYNVDYYIDYDRFTNSDIILVNIIKVLDTYGIVIYSIVGIIITSRIYYKEKIEQPLFILKTEAEHIGRGDLSFVCKYESSDEMAEICDAFDKMRLQLIENNKSMWNLMEEQSQINAAFAHDLRNPLAVLKGYNEMLIKFYPEGKVNETKLIKTLNLMNKQIIRIKNFSETMKDIRSASDVRIDKKNIDIRELVKNVMEISKGIEAQNKIKISVKSEITKGQYYFDIAIIEQVIDNLISNAVRYAAKEINIEFNIDNEKLCIYVKDDGKGFSKEELYKATNAFYSGEESHFGIGLSISKMLCEKHGGSITLSNSIDGGAIICAEFFIM